VTVVLTGEGADELFGGYFYHALERKAVGLDWLSSWVKQNLLTPGAKLINTVLGRERYHHRTLLSWQLQPAERVLAWMAFVTDEEKQRYFSPAIHAIGRRQLAANHFRQIAGQYGSYERENWLKHFTYNDVKIPLADGLLMKVDKMSMAASLEARCPFLDHHLAEYAFHIPETMKLDHTANKLVLREVARKILPEEIHARPKHGFDVPLQQWLEEDLRDMFWDLTSSKHFMDQDIIAHSQLEALWNSMMNRDAGATRQVWNIFILATWFDVFAV
jgi:asparagine synthase (glutamine-hydrolysing)